MATSETGVAGRRSSAFASATFPTRIKLDLKVAELKAANSGDQRKSFRLRPYLLRAPSCRLGKRLRRPVSFDANGVEAVR